MTSDTKLPTRVLPHPSGTDFEFRWSWVRDELRPIVRPERGGQGEPAAAHDAKETSSTPAIDPAAVMRRKVAFVVRRRPDGSVVIEGSAASGTVDVEAFLAAMRGDGYEIRTFTAFEAVSLPWSDSAERKVWVALVDATVEVLQDAIRRADAGTLRAGLLRELPEADGPPPRRRPL